MAPMKNARSNVKQNDAATAATAAVAISDNTLLPLACKGCTRKNMQIMPMCDNENSNGGIMQTRAKRKAEQSPVKNEKVKRTALDNVTNNANKQLKTVHSDEGSKHKKKDNNISQGNNQENIAQKPQTNIVIMPLEKQGHVRIITRASSRLSNNTLNKIVEDQSNNKSNGNSDKGSIKGSDKGSTKGSDSNSSIGVLTRANSRLQQNISNNKTKALIKIEEVKVKDEPEPEPNHKPNAVESTTTTTTDVFSSTHIQKQTNEKNENALLAPGLALQKQQQKLTVNKPGRRISNEFNEESVYMSAVEDTSGDTSCLSGNFEALRRRSSMLHKINEENNGVKENDPSNNNNNNNNGSEINLKDEIKSEVKHEQGEHQLQSKQQQQQQPQQQQQQQQYHYKLQQQQSSEPPHGVEDYDKANWDDQFQVSHYARDIFNYLKEREPLYAIDDYMPRQIHLSKWMRSLLVDWMVEVQETFELNHETLYLAVKIVDSYLCKIVIHKEKLQLLGAAALFIACKYDERTPPLIEDFLYICDGAYNSREMILMEMNTLRTIGFDLGMPLSYRFLRRYARCGKVAMGTLTLARYILELSLMDYETVSLSDSKKAAAALFMALRLHGDKCGWNATLEYHSGYSLENFFDIVPILNAGMHRKPKTNIKTIKSKYSHRIFYEVAKITPMTNDELFNIEMPIDEISDDSQYSSTTGILIETS